MCRRVVNGGKQFAAGVVVLADLNADSTLRDGGQHLVRADRGGDLVAMAETAQARNGQ